MSLLVSNSIPKAALKKMPSVCADILVERGIDYFESLELFTEELREMSPTVFKDSVIDMVAFNPAEFESATWLFQEAFCRIYPSLSEAMLFELSQTAADLVDNLQDYFLDFKIHEAELRILESFYKTTKKYAFIKHLRSQDYNLLVAILESEKFLKKLKRIPDDLDMTTALEVFEALSHEYENFLMDNPLCPHFMVNSGLSKKLHTILEFNYEFLIDDAPEQIVYISNIKYSFRPFEVKNGLQESLLSNSQVWESYSSYLLDCLKLETFFARDKIDWALSHGKYYFYKNDYELSYNALQKTHKLLLDKVTNTVNPSQMDLAMFKKRINRIAPVYQEAFKGCNYYLRVLRKSLLHHFSNSTQSKYTLSVLALMLDMLDVFVFVSDIASMQNFIQSADINLITKYYPLNNQTLAIVNSIKNNEFNLSRDFVLDLVSQALSEFNSDLSEVLL